MADLDLLAIAAHRDDAELTCGGTLIRTVDQGKLAGVLDLTQGEMGTRGSAYREDPIKPTFVVDITEQFDRKLRAVRCYSSQFDDAIQAGEVYPNGEPLYDVIMHQAAHYGSLIRTRYGEPFLTDETMRVDDVTLLDVSTF